MIGDLLTRTLALILGYAYPAYECFKTVELNKPDIDQLIFWCQYWILVAVLTLFERVGDNFISWLPMYSEAKLAFFVYLWYPKTKGTTYVYETFFRPYVAKHENEIDRNLLELRTRTGDMVILYFQKFASYGQTRIIEILQYVASQSQSRSSRPRPTQPQEQAHHTTSVASKQQPNDKQPQRSTISPANLSKSQPEEPTKQVPPALPASPAANLRTSTSLPAPASPQATSVPETITEGEGAKVAGQSSSTTAEVNPPPEETPIEEAIRVTRGRLRKRVANAAGALTR